MFAGTAPPFTGHAYLAVAAATSIQVYCQVILFRGDA
jgi:hypothetical protein